MRGWATVVGILVFAGSAILLAAAASAEPAAPLRFTLRDGTVLEGTTAARDADTVTIRTAVGLRIVYRENVRFMEPLRPAAPAPPSWLRRLDLGAAAGLGSFFGESSCTFGCATQTPSFASGPAVHLHAGLRALGRWTFALHFSYQRLTIVQGTPYYVDEWLAAWAVGGRVQWSTEFGSRFNLWVAGGVDAFARLSRGGQGTLVALQNVVLYDLDYVQAVALPLSVGLGYRILCGLSLGVSASASLWLPTARCMTNGTCSSAGLDPATGWFAGTIVRWAH
jgi:hypothetical protein